jgi:hypothetical protein
MNAKLVDWYHSQAMRKLRELWTAPESELELE